MSQTMIEPIPLEAGSDDVSEYETAARAEVLAILDNIVARRTLVTVHFGSPREQLVTNLLRLNPAYEEMIFDGARDDASNLRLQRTASLDFVTFADDIKIQFSTPAPEAAVYQGQPVLRARIPASLLRFQRRNFYRVPAPRSGPLTCEIDLPGGLPAKFPVTDLSVGGIAVLTVPALTAFQPGTVFPNCRVDLPGHGAFTTALEVRHTKTSKFATIGQGSLEYGCQFRNLSGPVVSQIQRYINQVERSRRALL
jgi:flagellar brake protein